MTEERWAPVAGASRYEVSTLGRVRNVRTGKILTPHLSRDGYTRNTLHLDTGLLRPRETHLLVLLAHKGPRPAGTEGSHLNGDRRNCRLDNLAWETKRENELRKVAHGTSTRGARNGRAKLTPDQVREIRTRKGSNVAMAAEYGVSHQMVALIRSGQAWNERETA